MKSPRAAMGAGVVAALVGGLLFSGGSANASHLADGPLLSDVGEGAIDDLRACLASNDTLDVYYLLDASKSLAKTDPGNVRSELVSNSLKELQSLREDLKVNFALGFFGAKFVSTIPWTLADSNSEQVVRTTISQQPLLGWTNWDAAVSGAQPLLSEQHRVTGGCQVLVWLTDGGLNLPGGAAATEAAKNNLCGVPGVSNGTFNELRQGGVVVLGVLLRDPNVHDDGEQYIPYMQPMVEGNGNGITCGEDPIPEGYARGAFVQASNTGDLALVFLRLGASLSGGYPSPFGADGSFVVDEGVARFSVITASSSWTLTAPNGESIESTGSVPDGYSIESSGGATKINSPSLDPDAVGTWKWTSEIPDRDDLYFYSGLKLELDEPKTFLAGADNQLSGRILRTDQRDVGADAYDYELGLAILAGGTLQEISGDRVELDRSTGEFTFHYSAEDASGIVTLEAHLNDLVTLPSKAPLASVSAHLDVSVTLPDQYPTIAPQPVALSTLEGSGGTAEGEFTITAPANGSSGKVCFPGGITPTVASDSADRADDWTWSVAGVGDCVELDSGTKSITVTAKNPVAANSSVDATLAVQYVSADGGTIDGSLPISFTSTRPVNVLTFGLLAMLLILLGLLLPLLGLLAVNWWTTRITRGGQLSRASVKVRIDQTGSVVTAGDGIPLRDVAWGTDQFRFQPALADARAVTDPDLGALRARVPLNPFGRPWFEIVPRAGMVVLATVGGLPASKKSAWERGALAGFNGHVGAVWGYVLPESTLRAGFDDGDGAMAATLVVFFQGGGSDGSTFSSRMNDIAVDPKLPTRISRARQLLLEHKSEPAASTDKRKTKAAAGSRATTKPSDDAPPPRSGSTADDVPPTRSASAPGGTPSSPPAPTRSSPSSPTVPPSSPPSTGRSTDDVPPPRRG